MQRVEDLSIYKIMTAGYLSVEAYSMLKESLCLRDLKEDKLSCYPTYVYQEIKQLFNNRSLYRSLCGLSKMQECILKNERQPYAILESLLYIYSSRQVYEFIFLVGVRFFLLDYVFSAKKSLNTRLFITNENISAISDFINKYQKKFFDVYKMNKEELKGYNKEISVKDDNTYETHELNLTSENHEPMCDNSHLYSLRKEIDNDAISKHNLMYVKYVEVLNVLNDEDFQPFEKYFIQCLETLPAPTKKCIYLVGIRKFYVNFLFADEGKLLNIKGFNRKALYDFSKVKPLIIDFMVKNINSMSGTIKEYNHNRNESIDENAISVGNYIYKKYIRVLCSLTDEEFQPFEDFFIECLEKVPIRTKNGICSVGIRNFYINYLFADDSKLLAIKNFGLKSVYDFGKIKQRLINFLIDNIDIETSSVKLNTAYFKSTEQDGIVETPLLKEILGDGQYAILNYTFDNLTRTLSTRARNGIKNYSGDFIEDFVHKDKNVTQINNIGEKSCNEIWTLILKLKEFVKTAKTAEDIAPEETKLLEWQVYYGKCCDEFSYQYFMDNGHLPMFHILENWFKQQSGRDWQILFLHFSIFNDAECKSLSEIADIYNLSRERCRQICSRLACRLSKIDNNVLYESLINYSKILAKIEDWKYITDVLSNSNLIEPNALQFYLEKENCCLSSDFCVLVLSIILRNHFKLVGRDLLSFSSRNINKWSGVYLIKSEYVDAFNFCDIPDILEEVEANLEEDVYLTVEQLAIDNFFTAWNNFDVDKVLVISDLLSHLLIRECGKIPDESLFFKLEGKKVTTVSSIVYNMLKQNGNPIDVNDLFFEFDKNYPNRCKSLLSFKSNICKDSRICMVGNDSLVGLLEWDHVKIGTIRDIIVQYLSDFDEPQSIADIVEYVQRYRDTTEKNIRSTMSSGKQFVHFKGALYGLKDKSYSAQYALFDKRRGFEYRVAEMEVFLRENLHFPFARTEDALEHSLNVWWHRVVNSDNLTDEQYAEVKRIQEKYKDYPTTRYDNEWMELYREYKIFIEKYARKPLRENPRETHLYIWFEKCRNDFIEGRMSLSKEKLYIELCNLL